MHEDKGMMAVMNVTRLKDFGYSELDARLEDPLDKRFQAQPYKGTNLDEIKSQVLPGFAKLKAYPDPINLVALEDKYWAQRSSLPASETSESVVPNMDPEKLAVHESHHGKTSGGNMHGMGSQSSSPGGAMAESASGNTGMGSHHGGGSMGEGMGSQSSSHGGAMAESSADSAAMAAPSSQHGSSMEASNEGQMMGKLSYADFEMS